MFHLREDGSGATLTDDIEIHFLELPKLNTTAVPGEEGLVNWLLFLKGSDNSNWEVLRMNEPALRKAMETLEFLSQDSEARRKYEDRQKFLHDEASQRDGAQREGFAKGMKEGIKEAKLEVARKLLLMGLDLPAIQTATGLTEEELKSIN
ncbi:hypothetical protein PAECIP111892_02161 [Paenibacillus auburnensis]|uniref:Rpn family recombination-promoting nuclease/putative transposase n=1 Tax=Paenibacillus auburnensis TaxID=2905649 RepID=A0ABM9BYC7_9BACL|nr:hypothetical protein PAECIP111892_02161 [Paenibacillus auburnensis]